MSIAKKMNELRSSGIELRVESDKIRYRAPRGAVAPELKEFLVRHKPEIISYLKLQELDREETSRFNKDFEERAARSKCHDGFSGSKDEERTIEGVFDLLEGQDRKAMSPEEFLAVIEVFSMLQRARDNQRQARRAS